MINSLVEKIANFFEKGFLFASFLPALLFSSAIAVTLAIVLGLDAATQWIAQLTDVQKVVGAFDVTLALIIFSYLIHALRPALLQFWSGTADSALLWSFWKLGQFLERRRFLRLRVRTERKSPWLDVLDWFRGQLAYDGGRPPLTDERKNKLLRAIRALDETLGPEVVKRRLQPLIDAYAQFSSDGLMMEVYHETRQRLDDWHRIENVCIQSDVAILDRQFGSIETLKPTRLGNIITAYQLYPNKRYAMEAEIFWPRLRFVIPAEYLALVEEPEILLNFLLASASLSTVYGLLALTVGPWLWYHPWFWGAQAAAAAVISFWFYRLSLKTAARLGDLVRSCYDLFRLRLMAALQRPQPATLDAEKSQWKELSQLAVYGFTGNFIIQERKLEWLSTKEEE